MSYKLKYLYLFFILNWSCYKEFKTNFNDKYILIGKFIAGFTPKLDLLKTNLETLNSIEYNEYKLEIQELGGGTYNMINGIFSNFVVKSGSEYVIKWKLNSEKEWHLFQKKVPKDNIDKGRIIYNKKSNFINSKLFKIDNNIYFYTTDINFGLFPYIQLTNKKELNLNLWPPKNLEIAFPSNYRDLSFYKSMYKCSPFNFYKYTNAIAFDITNLYSFSENDYKNLITYNESKYNKEEPLFDHKSYIYDYKNNNFYALVPFYNNYSWFKFKDYIDSVTNLVSFNLKVNNIEIDFNKFKIENLNILIKTDNNDPIYFEPFFINSTRNNGKLFFKNYIDYQYVQFYFNKNENYICKDFLDNYNIEVKVNYKNLQSNKKLSHTVPFYYDGVTSQTLTINLPE